MGHITSRLVVEGHLAVPFEDNLPFSISQLKFSVKSQHDDRKIPFEPRGIQKIQDTLKFEFEEKNVQFREAEDYGTMKKALPTFL